MFCLVLFNFRGKLSIVEVSVCMWMCVCVLTTVHFGVVCSWLLNVLRFVPGCWMFYCCICAVDSLFLVVQWSGIEKWMCLTFVFYSVNWHLCFASWVFWLVLYLVHCVFTYVFIKKITVGGWGGGVNKLVLVLWCINSICLQHLVAFLSLVGIVIQGLVSCPSFWVDILKL